MAKDGFTAKVHDALSDTMNLPPEFLSFLPQFIAQNPVSTLDHGTGYEVGYDQITSPVNITGTTEASPTTVIAGSEHAFDGSPVIAEFFSPSVLPPTVASQALIIMLFEGSTEIGRWGDIRSPSASLNAIPVTLRYRFTPSAGNHTYSIEAFVSSVTGTPAIQAGAGGSAAYLPAYLRFTKV